MDSANLKIQRAEKHYAELSALLRKHRPFRYFVETNFKTGEKATFAKKDEEVANHAAIIIGDLVHNLRSSLDHTYWDCTEQFAKSDGEKRNIQFPITSTERALKESVIPGLPSRVSESFALALEELQPYRDGGNRNLCLIHDLDVMDKHKLLIPTGNFTKITSAMIQKQVPDFPSGIVDCSFGNNYRDVGWRVQPMTWTQRRKAKIPVSNVLEKELDVPVETVLADVDFLRPALEILQEMMEATKEARQVLRDGVKPRV
ncbi:hypothetical protein EHN06_03050 [Marinobacter sp. NP-4(2019)]|uniref:hypothetical protein n=1 Tax=Marinobacter sp. NP-4(2019) TaxID=2488665 RepID=UPI000FC3D66C|nr:hypothetical protein [Marinobacter sp. NP-4(2019)]AZT82601.1 hypothetical protein EHN06_03050 [Marinobacter sp. NP-4(2019)]